ncbi:MAG TPA: hypothetical protein VF857_05890, partial [Spirochaetota bacterium]
LRPHEEKGYFQLANIYYSERTYKNRKKELIEASRQIENAIQLSPDNVDYRSFAIEIYTALGDEENANRHRVRIQKISGPEK